MAKHTRDLFVPFIDTTFGETAGTYTWVPVDLSTVFEFAFNPSTENYSYICYANDTTEVTGYAPTMDQEIVLDSSNPLYKAMREWMMSFPTGSKAKVPLMVVMPDMKTDKPTEGYMWADGSISPGSINTVDGKLTFTLNFNGDVTEGTVSGVGTDTVTFTPKTA